MTIDEKIQAGDQAIREMEKELIAFKESYTEDHPKYGPANSRLNKMFDLLMACKDLSKENGAIKSALKNFVTAMDEVICDKDGAIPTKWTEKQKDALSLAYFDIKLEAKFSEE